MRVVMYELNGKWHPGILVGEFVVNAAVAAGRANLSDNPAASQLSNRLILQLSPQDRSGLETAARVLASERKVS